MRKNLIIGLLVLLSIGVRAQFKFKGREFFKLSDDKQVKERLAEIVRTDSVNNQQAGFLIFRSFDKAGTLVRETRYNQIQNDSRRAYLTRDIYNKKKKIVFHQIFNIQGESLERFKFVYDDKGELIEKKKIE